MSIILDALKKAEETDRPKVDAGAQAEGMGAASLPPAGQPKPLLPGGPLYTGGAGKGSGGDGGKRRVIILGVLLVAMLGVILFSHLLRKKPAEQSAVPGGEGQQNVSDQTTLPQPGAPASGVTATAPTPPGVTNAATTPIPGAPTATADSGAPTNSFSQDPEYQELKETALQNYKDGNFDEAVADYGKLVVKDPENAELYNNFGVALRKLGLLDKAKGAYNKALQLNPNYTQAMNNLAVADIADNQYVTAKDLLKRAIQLDPEYMDPYLHLAICLEKGGEFEAAKENYETFLRLSEKKVDRKIRLQVEERLARLKEK